jgi:hypothetical protein
MDLRRISIRELEVPSGIDSSDSRRSVVTDGGGLISATVSLDSLERELHRALDECEAESKLVYQYDQSLFANLEPKPKTVSTSPSLLSDDTHSDCTARQYHRSDDERSLASDEDDDRGSSQSSARQDDEGRTGVVPIIPARIVCECSVGISAGCSWETYDRSPKDLDLVYELEAGDHDTAGRSLAFGAF